MRKVPPSFALLFADAQPAREGDTIVGFGGVAYSGGVVPNYGWHGDMAIDLSSVTLPATEIPVLLNHDPNQIVGRAAVTNDGNRISIGRGTFSQVTQAGKDVAALMAEGHPWQLSVGINAKAKSADREKAIKLNGREMHVDTVMRDARLLEFSFVPAGADPNAYAARLSARAGTHPETTQMPNARDDDDQLANLTTQVATLTAQTTTQAARIAELETNLAAVTAERDAARTELTNLAASARDTAIVDLFGKDHGLADATLAAYRAMTPDQFAALREAVTTARGQGGDPNLFRHVATGGIDPAAAGAGGQTYQAPAGFTVDPERAALHAKATKYAAEHKVDYTEAVLAVTTH